MKMRFSEASVNLSFFSGLLDAPDLAHIFGLRMPSEPTFPGMVPTLKLDLARKPKATIAL